MARLIPPQHSMPANLPGTRPVPQASPPASLGGVSPLEPIPSRGLAPPLRTLLLPPQPGQQRFAGYIQFGKNFQPFRHRHRFESLIEREHPGGSSKFGRRE